MTARQTEVRHGMRASDSGGQVYLIRAANGLTKIGRGKSARARCSKLQTASAARLTLHAYIDCAAPQRLEEDLHGALARYRTGGEWFALSPSALRFAQAILVTWGGERHATITRRLLRMALGLPIRHTFRRRF